MKKWIVVLLIMILIIGGGAFFWYKHSKQEAVSSNRALMKNATITVKKGSLEESVAASGYINPVEEVSLSFASCGATGGMIEKINVDEGSRVEAGQILVEIDSDDEKLKYFQAKNDYQKAMINASKVEVEEAKLKLEIAKKEVDNTKLKATFSGVIAEIPVEEGDYIESNATVVHLIDDSAYEVEVSIDESDAKQVKLGQEVRVTMEALAEEVAGEVVDIAAIADDNSGVITLPVTILITDELEYVKSNFSAEVEIIVNQIKEQLMIPITAIFSEQGRTKAVKMVNGKEEVVDVKTGLSNGRKIFVKDGLKEGDKILINTYRYLKDEEGSSEDDKSSKRMMRGMGGGLR